MRALRIIVVAVAVVALLIAFVLSLPSLLNPEYFGLRHKSQKWYEDFTAACDSVLAKHPLGTNKFLIISVTDPSLPKVITDLHPFEMRVSHQWFWMALVSDGHDGFGLTWDPMWGDTNIWVLHTTMESDDRVIYSATRSSAPNDRP